MKINIKLKNEELNILKGGVSSRINILKITASCGKAVFCVLNAHYRVSVTVSAPESEDGEIILQADSFFALMYLLEGAPVTIESTGKDTVLITCGKHKAKTARGTSFPRYGNVADFDSAVCIWSADLRRALSCARLTRPDPNMEWKNCIHIICSQGHMTFLTAEIALISSYTISICRNSSPFSRCAVSRNVIPALEMLTKIDKEVAVYFSDSMLEFRAGNISVITQKAVDSVCVKFDSFFADQPNTVTVSAEKVCESAALCSVSYLGSTVSKWMNTDINCDSMLFSARSVTMENEEETPLLSRTGDLSCVRTSFDVERIKTVFDFFHGNVEIHFTDAVHPFRLRSETESGIDIVLMPVRRNS